MNNHLKELIAIGKILAVTDFYKNGIQAACKPPDLIYLSFMQEVLQLCAIKEASDLSYGEKVIRNRVKQINKTIGLTFLDHIDAGIYHNSISFSKIVQGFNQEYYAIQKGIRLREFRKFKNLTIIEMAAALAVNPKNLQAWEAHKRDLPDNIYNQLN